MISFIPKADSFSGRVLARIGRLLGLRSETVYSRAFLMLALFLLLLGGIVSYGVWYALQREFKNEGEQALMAQAYRIQKYLWMYGATDKEGGPSKETLHQVSLLLGKDVFFRKGYRDTAVVCCVPGKDGGMLTQIPWQNENDQQLGVVEIINEDPLNRAGIIAARLFFAGLVIVGLATLVLIFMVLDRTVLARLHLLMAKLEFEKKSERLPVKLDFPGDDELAMLAASIEELAVLVQAGEKEFRYVVEDQAESVCRFDNKFGILVHNQAFEHLCMNLPKGVRPPMEECINAETMELIRNTYRRLSPHAPVQTITHAVTQAGGVSVWHRSTVRANFKEGASEPTGGQWIAVDMSSEVAARRQLQDSQRELQELSGRLMGLQDEERRRIARDLHDSTAQSLSALEMNTSLLEMRAKSVETRKLAGETRAIARQVCQELRNISYLLHPPLLEEQGLAFVIQWFAEGYTSRNGMPVSLEISSDFPRLDFMCETALFRIVQEAMNNIYRHSGATKVWIILREEVNRDIYLEVRDNGKGLSNAPAGKNVPGVGLAGMRERMNHLGGSLEVDSSPYGLSIKCRLTAIVAHAKTNKEKD